jgi:hypothetical protein
MCPRLDPYPYLDSMTRPSMARNNRLSPPPAKSVITTAPEEQEDQNDNQNSGHYFLHNCFRELAFLK